MIRFNCFNTVFLVEKEIRSNVDRPHWSRIRRRPPASRKYSRPVERMRTVKSTTASTVASTHEPQKHACASKRTWCETERHIIRVQDWAKLPLRIGSGQRSARCHTLAGILECDRRGLRKILARADAVRFACALNELKLTWHRGRWFLLVPAVQAG